jgi:hypothetical protein
MNYVIFPLIAVPLFSLNAIAQPITHPAAVPVQVAASQTPEKAIDNLTDSIFYRLYPRLNHRKIRSDETQYINEWAAIKKVVSQDSLVYQDACGRNSTNYEWLLSKYDDESPGNNTSVFSSPVLDKVADAIFYTRHPELVYRRIQPSEMRLASEWSGIRRAVSSWYPCD